MKLSKLFFGVAAAAMFAACSSDDIVAEQPQAQWNADGTGYIALNIGMPSTPVNRAGNNTYGDGLSKEYDVHNGVLLLFAGEKESNATLYAAYDLADTHFGMVGTADDNVTSDKLLVQQIKRPVGNPAYIGAFVVLNTNNNFLVDGTHHTLTAPSGVTTLASLQEKMREDIGKGDPIFAPNEFIGNGFMMTNAPLYSVTGGAAGTLQVLAEVDQAKIMGSKNLASQKANCAATVYVERAVAKVTMHEYTDVAVTTVTTPGQTNFTWTLNSWALDNVNSKSFLTRNTAEFDTWVPLKSYGTGITDYRFVGGTSVAHTGSAVGADGIVPLYRTYWAKDPNYSSDVLGTDLNTNSADVVGRYSATFGENHPQYCAENTFDVKHQNWENTTRVLLKTTMVPDGTANGTYYGRPGDEGFLSLANLKTIAYNTALEDLKGQPGYGNLAPGSITLNDVTLGVDGKLTVKLAGLAGTDPTSTALAATYTAGVVYEPADLGVSYYAGGVVYYQARIRHFDDTQTPWNVESPNNEWLAGYRPASGDTETIYPKATDNRANANYLGRWGVLRNNWYDLEITKITKLGYADPSELVLDDTPDDNLESWISLDVNILSWTKRTTSIEL